MQFRHMFAAALVAACGVLSSNAANALVVDIDAHINGESSVTLQPGTYTVTYASNGLYQAWNNCGVQACFDANTPGKWYDQFAIDVPNNNQGRGIYAPTFDTGSNTPSDALAFAQAALAANQFSRSDIIFFESFFPFNAPILITLSNVTNVGFYANTQGFFAEATGGISLNIEPLVSATPLPAALPLFATGLGVLGWAARRRKRKAAVIAAA